MTQQDWLLKEIQELKFCALKEKQTGIGTIRFLILLFACLFFGTITVLHCKEDIKSIICHEEGWSIWVCGKCGFRNYDGIEKCGVCGEKRK